MGKQLVKQPSEILKQSVAFDIGTDTIATVDATVVTARGLVAAVSMLLAVADAPVGSSVVITLSDGDDQEIYAVTVTATTSSGEKIEESFDVQVVDFSFQAPAGDGTTYLEPLEYISRFGLDEAVLLTDRSNTGRVDRDVLLRGLADATAKVDGYLAKRYLTPLTLPVPDLLEGIVADLARYILHTEGVSDAVTDKYKAAVKQLEGLASGKITISVSAATTVSVGSPMISSETKLFTRKNMEGF